jgi:hypothetical protein
MTGATTSPACSTTPGLAARQIADYIGHDKPGTTQDVYMDRGVVGELCGPALGGRPTLTVPKDGVNWGLIMNEASGHPCDQGLCALGRTRTCDLEIRRFMQVKRRAT